MPRTTVTTAALALAGALALTACSTDGGASPDSTVGPTSAPAAAPTTAAETVLDGTAATNDADTPDPSTTPPPTTAAPTTPSPEAEPTATVPAPADPSEQLAELEAELTGLLDELDADLAELDQLPTDEPSLVD